MIGKGCFESTQRSGSGLTPVFSLISLVLMAVSALVLDAGCVRMKEAWQGIPLRQWAITFLSCWARSETFEILWIKWEDTAVVWRGWASVLEPSMEPYCCNPPSSLSLSLGELLGCDSFIFFYSRVFLESFSFFSLNISLDLFSLLHY